MNRFDLLDTATGAIIAGVAGFWYGIAHDHFILGIPESEALSGKFPATAAKACAISYIALNILKAVILTAHDADILEGRNFRVAGILGIAAWGIASIVAFRQLNLIANLGTAVLSGFLAVKVMGLMNA